MAKDQGVIQTELRRRTTPGGAGGAGGGTGRAQPTPDVAPKRPFNPIQFLAEVRAEGRKTTWTTWKETWITSVMVGIMVILSALFFFAVDGGLSAIIQFALQLRTGS